MGPICQRCLAFGSERQPEPVSMANTGERAKRKQHQNILLLVHNTKLVRRQHFRQRFQLSKSPHYKVQHIVSRLCNCRIHGEPTSVSRAGCQHRNGFAYVHAHLDSLRMATDCDVSRTSRCHAIPSNGLDQPTTHGQEVAVAHTVPIFNFFSRNTSGASIHAEIIYTDPVFHALIFL